MKTLWHLAGLAVFTGCGTKDKDSSTDGSSPGDRRYLDTVSVSVAESDSGTGSFS